MDKAEKYLLEGDHILINKKLDFSKYTDKGIIDMMKNLDSFIKFHTDIKYDIIHIAHAGELYLKGLFIKKGLKITNKSFNVLIKELDLIIPKKSNEYSKILKNLEELRNFRNRFIHSIESGVMPAGGTVKNI